MTDATTQTQQEAHEFRAEVQQLLHILAHSLYKDREIFLRELISNASDALNRIKFTMLTDRDVLDPEAELAIWIDVDEDAGTITISDSGDGMTRDELAENLGTIAHSGAMSFLKRVTSEDVAPEEIIGQFGVGFYSVFMVADEVTVTSRSYQPGAEAWTWTSSGDERYTLAPAEKEDRGTRITITLKDEAEEFAAPWRLRQIIKQHSDYISFPIYLDGEAVNQQTALWRESPRNVEEDQYAEFYKQLTLDHQEPLLHVHLVTDVPVNLRTILYVPRRRERGLLQTSSEPGIRLYSRKVLIEERNADLLPDYLRFVEGVVDSEDLPLNVSRETVQRNPMVRQIRKALTSRLIKELETLADERPDEYTTFWTEFGVFLKEGIASDVSSHGRLRDLLRFHSSKAGEEELVSLPDYVYRMQDGQEAIYYVLGEDLHSVRYSPHLDPFRAHDIEVLYLVEPVDSFMMTALREYDGTPLQNVEDADLEMPAEGETTEEDTDPVVEEELERLMDRFRQVLGDRVEEVRVSRRLKDSPVRLISTEEGPARDLQRVRRLMGEEVEVPAMVLELNRTHRLIQNLARRLGQSSDDALVDATIEQLFDNALLVEGLHPNPASMAGRIQRLMEAAVDARSEL